MIPIVSDLIKTTVGGLLDGAIEIIKKVVPDKDAQLRAEAELRTIGLQIAAKAQEMEHDQRMGQVDLQKIDAASSDPYQRRARPTIMWICAISMGYYFVVYPIAAWVCVVKWPAVTPPALPDIEYLMALIAAMLGMGGYRTYEKMKGVSS